MARTPRVEYGFFHDDSNKNTAPLARAAAMCRARVSLNEAGNGTYRSLPPLPLVMRIRQASRSVSVRRIATSSATRTPV